MNTRRNALNTKKINSNHVNCKLFDTAGIITFDKCAKAIDEFFAFGNCSSKRLKFSFLILNNFFYKNSHKYCVRTKCKKFIF